MYLATDPKVESLLDKGRSQLDAICGDTTRIKPVVALFVMYMMSRTRATSALILSVGVAAKDKLTAKAAVATLGSLNKPNQDLPLKTIDASPFHM